MDTLIIISNIFMLAYCVVMLFIMMYEDCKEAGHLVFTKRGRIGILTLLILLAFNLTRWFGDFPQQFAIDTFALIAGAMLIGAGLNEMERNNAAKEAKRIEHERIERLMDYTEIDYTKGIQHDQNLHASTNYTRTNKPF